LYKFMLNQNILELIGQTPLVKLNKLKPSERVNMFAKLEGQNPGGSIKDRIALAMINEAERTGKLTKRQTIIEPSSGNTGIGLAMVGAIKGYKVKIIMPENATRERVILLKKYGAEVEFCNSADWVGETAITRIRNFAQQNPDYIMLDKYKNPIAAKIHYQTTAAEIISQCPQITHFVSAMGTGGTITGVGKRLKEYNSKIKIIGVEIKPGSKIPGPRNLATYIPPILDFQNVDQRMMIEDENQVFKLAEDLALQEGIFYGLSSAAALSAALATVQESENSEANIVIIFPDRGDKYFSLCL
jgi:cysteine synthase